MGQIVSISLFIFVLVSGYQAGWFTLIWTWQNLAILGLVALIAWTGRNEFAKSNG